MFWAVRVSCFSSVILAAPKAGIMFSFRVDGAGFEDVKISAAAFL